LIPPSFCESNMPRELEFKNTKVVIIAESLIRDATRDVNAVNPVVFITYPDGTTGTELAMIAKETASVVRAVDELENENAKAS